MNRLRIVILGAALLACSCASAPESESPRASMEAARTAFYRDLASCTKTYGYDPEKLPPLGPHQLGVNERKWRSCAYDAIEVRLIPASRNPELYSDLIASDRVLTNEVEEGIVTRSERRERIREMLATIEAREAEGALSDDQTAQAEADQARAAFTQRMVRSFR
jgi:hypothetical protein